MPPTAAGPCGRGRLPAAHLFAQGRAALLGHPRWAPCRAWLQQATRRACPAWWCQESLRRSGANRHQGDTLAFAAPPLQRSKPSPALVPLVASALGLRPTKFKRRNCWTTAPCGWACCWTALTPCSASRPTMLASRPGSGRGRDPHRPRRGYRPRAPRRCGARLPPPHGQPGDPVTGSLNASLAQWLIAEGLGPTRYLVAQGECRARLAGCTSARMPRGRYGWAATP